MTVSDYDHPSLLLGAELSLYWIIPFIGMLLSIAILPLIGGTLTGNLTISNASPALNLTDTDNASNIAFSSIGGALIVNSTSDQVYQIGGTEKFRVASSAATFAGTVNINNSGGNILNFNRGSDPLISLYENATIYGFYNNTTAQTDFSVNHSSGNVGIGTTSPGAKLHVSGNQIITTTLSVGTTNVSTTAKLQSLKPAPVASLNCFTFSISLILI